MISHQEAALVQRKNWRLNLRGTAELGQLLERAAALNGLEVQDFARMALSKASVDTIRDHDLISIAEADGDAFMAMWNDTSAPAPDVWARARTKAETLEQP